MSMKFVKNILFFVLFLVLGFSFNAHHAFATDKYWVGGGSSANWGATSPTNWALTSGGANNAAVPTSSDNVFFDANSGSGTSIISLTTQSVKSLDMTGYTGTLDQNSKTLQVTLNNVNNINSVIKLSSAMTYIVGSGSTAKIQVSGGSGCATQPCSVSLTTAGKIMPKLEVTLANLTQTLNLMDDFTSSSFGILMTGGILNTNNHNISSIFASFTYITGRPLTVNLGSSNWTITGGDATTNNNTSGTWTSNFDGVNAILNPGTSTIKFTDSTSDNKTICNYDAVNSLPYNAIFNNIWLSGSGTGSFVLNSCGTGPGAVFTFNDFKVDTPPHTISMPFGTTTVNTFTVAGTAGNLMTFTSDDPGITTFTLSKPSGIVSSDYLSLADSIATGGASWYAGGHSTNGGSNTGWVFESTPPTAAITYSINHAVKAGDTQRITATFSEAMVDSPAPKISISGANTVSATPMTKIDSTHYYYDYVVGTGNGTDTVALSVGTDLSSNVVTSSPTSGSTFTVDNTAPTNQNTVFASSASVSSGQVVYIASSGTASNSVWFAPSGTTSFSVSNAMTTVVGTDTAIASPVNPGTYKLFVIDIAGNISAESTATLTVNALRRSGGFTVFTPLTVNSSSVTPITETPSNTPVTTPQATTLTTSTITRNLKLNAKGDDVKALQAYFKLTPDGVFGPKTKQAVIKLQKAHNLTADGIVGAKTREVINKQ